MPAGRSSLDPERRKQALRKRLALDFQPLRDTLSKGLGLLVDPEAAVLCTATVEGFCNALFTIAIKQLAEAPAARTGPPENKITVFHLQVALRSHPELAELLQRAESARMALEFFLDDATSRALYERKLIASREAKHLLGDSAPPRYEHEDEGHSGRRGQDAQQRAEQEEELIRRHERTRSEWQKREDDPFSEVDFAMVLKCVHPAFTLSYNATMLLSALVRELLNEVCARADVDALQRNRHPPELLLEDLQGPLLEVFCGVSTGKTTALEIGSLPDMGALGTQVARIAIECLARYRLQSRRGKTLTLHFRVYQPGSSSALQPLHVLPDVVRDTPFAKLLAQIRNKCHLPVSVGHRGGTFSDTRGQGEFIAIYRAHQVEPSATPAMLAMPTGAVVYLVARRWWDLTRRTEARRGLLSSQRPQDALVRSLVAGTESKVKKELRAAGVGVCNVEDSTQQTHTKRGLAGNASNSSLLSTSSSSIGLSKSPSRLPVTQEEDSLSVLLRERAAARREKGLEKRGALASGNNNNNLSDSEDPSGSFARLPPRAQAAETLNQAWLEFEEIAKSVRTTTERLAQWTHTAKAGEEEPPNLSLQHLELLEDEWRARVYSTEELAIQTRAAHQLATRMLGQARSGRALPRAEARSSSTT
ncbi:hypothetical protein PR003_g7465 [Phytophthora rubi]|uniref:Uncharacterized protein n=1 Tax=Phytophthora rubi TaxID=129364 RepID=A0A6A3N6A9_9STRA|nr:hypothetical protein PR002_g7336 [Phytophthora rubi]KAE9040845.1 hypothetical protein PR001_g6882 [Phytophthora rubi]KAE9346355.1 hypothetical protein PR003_g7465 [Phytophthora rubi]